MAINKKHEQDSITAFYKYAHKTVNEMKDDTIELIKTMGKSIPINNIMEIEKELLRMNARLLPMENINLVALKTESDLYDVENEYIPDDKIYNKILTPIKYALVFIKTLIHHILKGDFENAFREAAKVASNVGMIKTTDALSKIITDIKKDSEEIAKNIYEFVNNKNNNVHNDMLKENNSALNNILKYSNGLIQVTTQFSQDMSKILTIIEEAKSEAVSSQDRSKSEGNIMQ